MLRDFARDSLVYGATAVLTRFAGLILLPILARVLSPDEIGAIDLIGLAIALAQVTVALEISQGFARFYGDRHDQAHRTRLASSTFGFSLVAYSIFLVLGLLGANAFSDLLLGGRFGTAVHIAVATAWMAGLLQLVLNQAPVPAAARKRMPGSP